MGVCPKVRKGKGREREGKREGGGVTVDCGL